MSHKSPAPQSTSKYKGPAAVKSVKNMAAKGNLPMMSNQNQKPLSGATPGSRKSSKIGHNSALKA
jgi:hypothetical protein